MSAAAQVRRATRKVRGQSLSWSACFEIAITIGKSNHAVGIRDVQKLWIVPGRIEGDPEWFVQIAFGKNFGHVRLTVAVTVTQHLDLVDATLHDKYVAIRRG